MSLSIEDAQKVSNLRLRMVENMAAGRPSHDGVSEDELREALAKVRKSRSLGQAGAGTTSSKKAANIPLDLNEWIKK